MQYKMMPIFDFISNLNVTKKHFLNAAPHPIHNQLEPITNCQRQISNYHKNKKEPFINSNFKDI